MDSPGLPIVRAHATSSIEGRIKMRTRRWIVAIWLGVTVVAVAGCGASSSADSQRASLSGILHATIVNGPFTTADCVRVVGSPQVAIKDGAGAILGTTKASAPRSDSQGNCVETYSITVKPADVYQITTVNSTQWTEPKVVDATSVKNGRLPMDDFLLS